MSFLFMHIKFYHVVAVSVFSSGTAYIASHAEFFFSFHGVSYHLGCDILFSKLIVESI